MIINKQIIEDFDNTDSMLLAVTKYWDKYQIEEFKKDLNTEELSLIVWFWENRVASLKEKELDRDFTHFIWNIQTKEIKTILKYCDTIHSVDNKKHIKKIEEICEKQDNWVKIFLQINVDTTKEWWISPDEIPEFIALIDECDNISLVWFSAIWKAEFTREEKIEEFRLLKELRTKYIPNWVISAWTSRDYKIALEEGINLVRIGSALVESD